jgi:gliding motility-associated lipoprotein GldK
MKKILKLAILPLFAALIASCGQRESGQLIGVQDRPSWKPINPYGMVYIPSGTLHIGPSDQDINFALVQRPKAISIQGFFMDDTEITNNEYRQFVNWVRDSMAHNLIGNFIETDEGKQLIDWEQEIDWSDADGTLQPLFYKENERFAGRKEIDTRKFYYNYEWYDWKDAANSYYWKNTEKSDRLSYIIRESVPIYPDTLVWIRDFSYSYNEPMTRNYFWHPAFDDYPVVGVAWKQANAFSYWRTKLWNSFRLSRGEVNSEDFRLPTEHEWEYASRGGHDLAPYPWGGYYVRNAKGCILANFKPGRGNYPEDGGLYTVRADAYFPNDYGLYNMSGNVAEWTSSAYYENAYSFLHDLNPDIRYDAKDDDPKTFDKAGTEPDYGDPKTHKRKVIRGGSWKDIAYYCQTGTRHWEFQDSTKSYIGFRCALTFLGRSLNDFR